MESREEFFDPHRLMMLMANDSWHLSVAKVNAVRYLVIFSLSLTQTRMAWLIRQLSGSLQWQWQWRWPWLQVGRRVGTHKITRTRFRQVQMWDQAARQPGSQAAHHPSSHFGQSVSHNLDPKRLSCAAPAITSGWRWSAIHFFLTCCGTATYYSLLLMLLRLHFHYEIAPKSKPHRNGF